ncbi:MAG: PAS domain S-box protein [Chloroflexi bacterium]|nr:PAS domain S-box protein [Chloroflexota bacterium]
MIINPRRCYTAGVDRSQSPDSWHRDAEDANSLFILCEDVPIMLAIRPVLPNDEAGPAVGKLVWGYLLDTAAAAELSARQQIDISFKAVTTPCVSNDNLSNQNNNWLQVEMTDTSITSVVKIAALEGFVEMRIDEPREIIQQARLNYLHFTMALALFGVVLISGTLFLVDRMMLARVTHLSSAVKTIGKSPGSRISIDGRDEISTLTEAINAMLVDVAESHQALESLNLQLEARVKERTAALEAQDARLQAIVDTMGEGLAYTVDGSVEVANPTLAQMIGFTREELIGRPFNQLTPKMNMTVTQMMLSSPNRYETKLLHKDGSMIDVAINATPVNMGMPVSVEWSSCATSPKRRR